MPRKNAYAISLTTKVRQRIYEMLDVIKASACPTHSGQNLDGAIATIKIILSDKSTHKHIK